MTRRIVVGLTGVVITCTTLTGCLFNTPGRVVERFVGRLKGMRWKKMAELVDWPQSSQYVSPRYVENLPASNKGEDDAKKDVMMRIAENLTGFPVRKKTPEQIRHEFIYLKLARLEHMKDGDNWAWLEITVSTEKRAKTVQVLLMKINRIWRIVLSDSVFE